MSWRIKAMKNMEESIPKTGYNLVKMDDYEDFGEQLSVVGSFPTQEEADAAKEGHEKAESGVVLYIYGPEMAKAAGIAGSEDNAE